MRYKEIGLLMLLTMLGCSAMCQEVVVLKGRVVDGNRGVPYATLRLGDGPIGVCCNDLGEYELKVPTECLSDSVEVHSVGYARVRVAVGDLRHSGRIKLQAKAIELREVNVSSYQDARRLMRDVVERIAVTFCQQTAYSTFFYRDWRAVDGELYLFDEAVMEVERAPYTTYAQKRGYRFVPTEREMETNYKTLLRHRLVVNDRRLVEQKVGRQQGVNEVMEYADDKLFYDPAAAPNASFSLSEDWILRQSFYPLMEFTDGGEGYYLVRAKGSSAISRETNYEFVVRKYDLGLVRITSWIVKPTTKRAPQEDWIKPCYTRQVVEIDSTSWFYGYREGKLTLTRYFSTSTTRLTAGRHTHGVEEQCWQQSVDWTLTDFSTTPSEAEGDTVDSQPKVLDKMFGRSDFSPAFWGHYNTIPIDSLPARLLEQKLLKINNR